MWSKLKPWVEKYEYIIIILGLTIALRIPSLLEPYWYGDEGIYLTIGQALRRGLSLYQQIHDNKPPFLYWVAALTNGSLFWFKFLALAANLAAITVFWKLTRIWWKAESHSTWSTLLFSLLTTLPFLEGNIANAEIFFLLPTLAAFYLLYKNKNHQSTFWAGLLFGLAALFKMPALLEIAIWPIYWLLIRDKEWFRKSFLLGLGAALPILLSLIYYFTQQVLPSYLIAAGLQNVPYLSSWQAVPGIVGTLKGRAVIALILIVIVSFAKNKLGRPLLLLSLWWIVTLFSALLSGRPYPHYLLQMTPAISLAAIFFLQGKTARLVSASLFILLAISFVTFKFYLYPIAGYYANFIHWSVGQKTSAQYYSWFNPAVDRNYKIAERIVAGSSSDDQIFVWGDEPMIYALSKRLPVGRYTAKYHIGDFQAHQETIDLLTQHPPKYIVTIADSLELPGLTELLDANYIRETDVDHAQIYRLLYNLL